MRFIIAGTLMVAYRYYKNPETMKLRRSDIWGLLKFSLLMMPSFAVEFLTYGHISDAKIALMFNLTPFLTALFAYFQLNENMTWKKWVGLSIGFIGMVPVFCGAAACSSEAALWALTWWDLFFFVGSVVSGAYMWVVFKEYINKGAQEAAFNGYAMLIVAGLLFVLAGIFEGPWNPVPVVSWGETLWLLGYLMLVGNVIYFNLYGYLLRSYTTTFLSFCGFVTPLFTAFIDYFFLGRIVPVSFYVSILIVSVGLYIFHHEEIQQGYTKKVY
jgi:drug/metabolite transporter (DMT)-like permease